MSLSKFSLSEEELEEQAIESLLFEHIEDFVEEPLHKKKRCAKIRVDYWNTTWGRNSQHYNHLFPLITQFTNIPRPSHPSLDPHQSSIRHRARVVNRSSCGNPILRVSHIHFYSFSNEFYESYFFF